MILGSDTSTPSTQGEESQKEATGADRGGDGWGRSGGRSRSLSRNGLSDQVFLQPRVLPQSDR